MWAAQRRSMHNEPAREDRAPAQVPMPSCGNRDSDNDRTQSMRRSGVPQITMTGSDGQERHDRYPSTDGTARSVAHEPGTERPAGPNVNATQSIRRSAVTAATCSTSDQGASGSQPSRSIIANDGTVTASSVDIWRAVARNRVQEARHMVNPDDDPELRRILNQVRVVVRSLNRMADSTTSTIAEIQRQIDALNSLTRLYAPLYLHIRGQHRGG